MKLIGIDAPSALRNTAQQILSGEDAIEEFLGAEGAGEGVRVAYDRDGFEACQARLLLFEVNYALTAVSTMCISMPRSSQTMRPSSVRTTASETVFRSETDRDRREQ